MRVIEIHHGELIESSTNQGAQHAAIVAPHRHYRLPPGSTLVGHCSGRDRCFDGLVVATRRRIFRRNPDNTAYLNLPSITLDIGNVELDYANEGARS
jgi:hypothetical protein